MFRVVISQPWLLQAPARAFKKYRGTSLVIQWLRLHASNAGDPGSISDQGTRPYMLQLLRPGTARLLE